MTQQLGFGLRKFKPTLTTATSGAAPSALRSALDSIKHPSLRSDSSLAAKRRAEALHVFFFQAEDGIRDCLLSRGLGDVYKRQKYMALKASVLCM